MLLHLTCYKPSVYYYLRKELSLNQKNKGAAIEKPLFVVQGCLEMKRAMKSMTLEVHQHWAIFIPFSLTM